MRWVMASIVLHSKIGGYLAFAALLTLAPALARAQCAFLPERPRPSWVAGQDAASADYVYGIGVGRGDRAGAPDDLLRRARQSALADLAEAL